MRDKIIIYYANFKFRLTFKTLKTKFDKFYVESLGHDKISC